MFKCLVKELQQENKQIHGKLNKTNKKWSKLIIKYNKLRRFSKRIKKSNGNLLRQRRYWKKECLQERKKHQDNNDKLFILIDLGAHILHDTL